MILGLTLLWHIIVGGKKLKKVEKNWKPMKHHGILQKSPSLSSIYPTLKRVRGLEKLSERKSLKKGAGAEIVDTVFHCLCRMNTSGLVRAPFLMYEGLDQKSLGEALTFSCFTTVLGSRHSKIFSFEWLKLQGLSGWTTLNATNYHLWHESLERVVTSQ